MQATGEWRGVIFIIIRCECACSDGDNNDEGNSD
jgi:hypothetical protein